MIDFEFLLRFLFVFLISAIGDVFWTLYFIEIEKRNAFMAALWGALIMLIAGATIINYSYSHWLLVASVSGGFVGTYLTVKFKKK